MKKILVTLNIGNYQPAIRALTYPLMKRFADKIHADFIEITERKFPDWPTVYEKLQCREILEAKGADWCLFFDADALINPEMFDPTLDLNLDTVLFNGKDMSRIRFYPDKYFQRDGRFIGACNWFCVSSRLTACDLYRPLDDLTLEEAIKNISITNQEHVSGMFKDNHLIDDYTLSRNLSQFSLKHDTLIDVCGRMGMRNQFGGGVNPYLWHKYSCTEEQKINDMLALLATPNHMPVDAGAGRQMQGWQCMTAEDVVAFRSALFQNERKQWDLKVSWLEYCEHK